MARIVGIAIRAARRAPMVCCSSAAVTIEAGLEGDHKGARFPKRQVTLMAIEDWRAALAALEVAADQLEWTTRRANVLTHGIRLPRVAGARLRIGSGIVLDVTGQTVPCRRMDEAHDGLRRALAPEWRGGLICSVVAGGTISIGDSVELVSSPHERTRRLP